MLPSTSLMASGSSVLLSDSSLIFLLTGWSSESVSGGSGFHHENAETVSLRGDGSACRYDQGVSRPAKKKIRDARGIGAAPVSRRRAAASCQWRRLRVRGRFQRGVQDGRPRRGGAALGLWAALDVSDCL